MSLVKFHPLVRREIVADTEVARLVGDRVFAGQYPEGLGKFPAIRFRFAQAVPLEYPVPTLWDSTGDFDVHAPSEDEADEIADALLNALLRLEGTTHDEGDVISVDSWVIESSIDDNYTPPMPHRVVTVTLTARRQATQEAN